MAAELTPVAPQERIALFDVLRGFCLFGVLWSNLNDWYTVAAPATSFDHAIRWTQDWLLESRFYSMLGFLFGIGFAIQLTRATQRGQDVRHLFLRRMAALLGFGIIHALLIWHGDILVSYALAGFALVLFRRSSPRTLLIAAIGLAFLFPYVVFHAAAIFHLPLPRYDDTWRTLIKQTLQAFAHGTWVQAVSMGDREFGGWLIRSVLLGGTASFLALFILGLCAVRVDLIARLTRRRSTVLWALCCALACWAGLQYVQLHQTQWWPAPPTSSGASWRQLRFWWPLRADAFNFVNHTVIWANSAVYALLFALALSFRAGVRRLQPLAAVGRMTLTTYLVQSVFSTVVFYNWGFGLMNRTNLTGILLFTVTLFFVQMVFSVWWLDRFRFGPAEWLWRSLAYGKRLPLRIATSAPETTSAAVTA
jgi:uncharacterized protein